MLPPFAFPVMSYDIGVLAVAWGVAAHGDFSPGWLALASAVTAIVVVVIVRRLVRLAALRRQLRTPDHSD
jgi:hypothetical protein